MSSSKHSNRTDRPQLPNESSEERVTRAMNEKKRERLKERFGAKFGPTNPDMPADVESEWLDNIERFEEAAQHASHITVREYLGDPKFHPLEELSPERLGDEIERVMELLDDNNVHVDFLSDVSDPDVYMFLTTELMDQVIEDIRLDGFMTCFIYEEFHPNHRMEIEERVNDLFFHLFRRDTQYLDMLFAGTIPKEDQSGSLTRAQHVKRLKTWIRSIAVFTTHITNITDCRIAGDDAVVHVATRWSGLEAVSMGARSVSGDSIIHLRREFGRWMISQMQLAGFEE